jgi:hypothetical protein
MLVHYLAPPPCAQDESHEALDPYRPFGSPHNWCDRRCDHCPIQAACPLRRRELQTRWVREARGEDPDDARIVMRDVQANLERALVKLKQAAADEGIDPDELPPMQPIALDMIRLQRSGSALVKALDDALARAPDADCVCEAFSIAFKVACKCGRVGGYLNGGWENIWLDDVVPNLLLIEQLFRRLDETIALGEPRFDRAALAAARAARSELERILAPLFADVSAADREHMKELIQRGLAPSPFSMSEP